MRRRTVALWVGIVCALLLVGVTLAQGVLHIDWYNVGGGGGEVQSGNLLLKGSIGQPVAGPVRVANLELQSGYWAGAVPTATPSGPTPTPSLTPSLVDVVRLPLVIKRLWFQ